MTGMDIEMTSEWKERLRKLTRPYSGECKIQADTLDCLGLELTVSITLRAIDQDDARKKVKSLLMRKDIREAIASQVKRA